jgi:hypothetical protein
MNYWTIYIIDCIYRVIILWNKEWWISIIFFVILLAIISWIICHILGACIITLSNSIFIKRFSLRRLNDFIIFLIVATLKIRKTFFWIKFILMWFTRALFIHFILRGIMRFKARTLFTITFIFFFLNFFKWFKEILVLMKSWGFMASSTCLNFTYLRKLLLLWPVLLDHHCILDCLRFGIRWS